jgi:hypothetical protein
MERPVLGRELKNIGSVNLFSNKFKKKKKKFEKYRDSNNLTNKEEHMPQGTRFC